MSSELVIMNEPAALHWGHCQGSFRNNDRITRHYTLHTPRICLLQVIGFQFEVNMDSKHILDCMTRKGGAIFIQLLQYSVCQTIH